MSAPSTTALESERSTIITRSRGTPAPPVLSPQQNTAHECPQRRHPPQGQMSACHPDPRHAKQSEIHDENQDGRHEPGITASPRARMGKRDGNQDQNQDRKSTRLNSSHVAISYAV